MIKLRICLSLLLLATLASAWNLTPANIHAQAAQSRDGQLREFQQSYAPNYDSYVGLGWVYLPFASQSRLQSPYGLHDGFAFRHRAALLLQNPIDSSAYRIGLAWWIERQGWDQEDFLALAPYKDYGLVRDIHTAAVMFSDTKRDMGWALGVQYQNPEHVGLIYAPESDSLWWFTHAMWSRMSLQAVFHRSEWQTLRFNANLADRQLRGGAKNGLGTYWPDLEAAFLRGTEDPLHLRVRQNLYSQRVFLDAAYRPVLGKQAAFTLQLYPDASELLGLELGAIRTMEGDWRFGGDLEMPLFRVGYNAPRDAEELFDAHGTWILEFHISLGAIAQESIFRRNAPRPAPMETDVKINRSKPVRGSDWKPQGHEGDMKK